MKSFLVAAAVIAIATSQSVMGKKVHQEQPLDTVFDPSKMSDTQMVSFIDNVAFRMWSSFLRGWYSKSSNTAILKVDDQCFGSWIVKDMLQIDNTLTQLMEKQTTSLPDLLEVGQAAYRLGFKNFEYCRF